MFCDGHCLPVLCSGRTLLGIPDDHHSQFAKQSNRQHNGRGVEVLNCHLPKIFNLCRWEAMTLPASGVSQVMSSSSREEHPLTINEKVLSTSLSPRPSQINSSQVSSTKVGSPSPVGTLHGLGSQMTTSANLLQKTVDHKMGTRVHALHFHLH